MNSNHSWRLNSKVILELSPGLDGGMLMDTATATVCSVNLSAMKVLEALSSGANVAQLTHILRANYKVSAKEAKQDVLALFRQLRSLGLLEVNA
jgi:hypothetical protein